jgi:hypothetical protein
LDSFWQELHNQSSEYITQEEHNILRLFVPNGGTIVFAEVDALYADRFLVLSPKSNMLPPNAAVMDNL